MKLSVFKEIQHSIIVRLSILKASIIYTFQEDTAYVAENWAAVLSTISYSLSFAIFVKVLYSNVDTFAGYTESEMLFLLLVAHISFFVQYLITDNNISRFPDFVNSGELDLHLSKPVPLLFYLSLKRISVVSFIRDGIPDLLFLSLFIDWSSLSLPLIRLGYGTVIFVLGMVTIYCISLISILPVFWIGRSSEIYSLAQRMHWLARREIPYTGYSVQIRTILSTILPLLISSSLSTSVILAKTSAKTGFLLALTGALVFSIIVSVLWKKALRTYSSASS